MTVSAAPPDTELAAIAESRLKELEELKQERFELLQKLDSYRIDHAGQGISEERVRESSLFQSLESELGYHRSENHLLKKRLDTLTVEFEEMQSDRRKFIAQVEVFKCFFYKFLRVFTSIPSALFYFCCIVIGRGIEST